MNQEDCKKRALSFMLHNIKTSTGDCRQKFMMGPCLCIVLLALYLSCTSRPLG